MNKRKRKKSVKKWNQRYGTLPWLAGIFSFKREGNTCHILIKESKE